MERVAELKAEPVVGKTYLVLCVRVDYPRGWVPVMRPMHEDKAFIGFPDMHWHYDFRFVSDTLLNRLSKAKRGELPNIGRIWNRIMSVANPESERTKERALKCRRTMPDYCHALGDERRKTKGTSVPFIATLEAAYADANVIVEDGCRLCPHRRMTLNGLPKEKGGVVTCRGHGLRWSKSGRLVPREMPKAVQP